MALVFQDGFDCWGSGSTSRTNMLNSSNMWVSIPSTMGCTTTVSRTGTHSLYQPGTGGSVGDAGAIFSLGSAKTSADGYHGFGFAFRPTNLPSAPEYLLQVRNSSGTVQYTLYVTITGALDLTTSTSLSTTASGVIVNNVFTHIEVKQKVPTTYNATDGELYIKVNGTQLIAITGTDITVTSGSGAANFETVALLPGFAAQYFGNSYIDDLVVWDSTGTYCNDWIGNKSCYLGYADTDTATADWDITGTTYGYDAINDTTPDADTTYLAATAVNDTSIFEIGGFSSTLTGVKAVTVHSAIRQDSEGSSEFQASLGGTSYTDGTSRVAPFPGVSSTTFTAYQDHFYQDPDGAGNFTPTIINALKLKLKRTV